MRHCLKIRRFLLLIVAIGTASFLGVSLAQEKFVYWGGLIFSDEANSMFVKKVEEWGKTKGIAVEVVMINQNETVQRVSAALEAGTMPDALDLGRDFTLLLSQNGQLTKLDELYQDIGEAHGGWLDSVNSVISSESFGGHIYGIPYAASGANILFRRHDVLETAGYASAPQTWEELSQMATAQNPPQTYGMGFALSNVGDANLTTTMLQSWGGRIADDTGTTCTLDSPETRAFLEWITGAFSAGLFPPGVTTWDGAGDNTAYQSGNALFIANPGSVYLNIKENDPELLEATRFSALPGGPAMRIAPVSTVVRAIPISTSDTKRELAEDLFRFLADDDFMAAYMNAAIYGPALQSQVGFAVFKDSPVHMGLLDVALNGTAGSFPDVDNAAFSEYQTNFLTPKMIQRIVVDNLSIDQAIAETQQACQAIYDKNN